jgi:hypothetical protein
MGVVRVGVSGLVLVLVLVCLEHGCQREQILAGTVLERDGRCSMMNDRGQQPVRGREGCSRETGSVAAQSVWMSKDLRIYHSPQQLASRARSSDASASSRSW